MLYLALQNHVLSFLFYYNAIPGPRGGVTLLMHNIQVVIHHRVCRPMLLDGGPTFSNLFVNPVHCM